MQGREAGSQKILTAKQTEEKAEKYFMGDNSLKKMRYKL